MLFEMERKARIIASANKESREWVRHPVLAQSLQVLGNVVQSGVSPEHGRSSGSCTEGTLSVTCLRYSGRSATGLPSRVRC